MRILFIPCVATPIPHLLPLLALAARLDRSRHHCAFLVPAAFHEALRQVGYEALPLDNQPRTGFRQELAAQRLFRPDVVVDDLSATALMSTRIAKTPRVTVRRTGLFPGDESCSDLNVPMFNELYKHCEAVCGLPAPRNLVEMCAAQMNIVAGIATVEVLSPEVARDPSYVFAGPLIVSDAISAAIVRTARGVSVDHDAVGRFLDAHEQRDLVYLTRGSVMEATDTMRQIIRDLLDAGFPVVSNVLVADLPPALRPLFFHARFLPMHAVCARAWLMIHHCGSGTYQYQLAHAVPGICLGSGRQVRDDVAMRLQELGVARYVPHAEATAQAVATFRTEFAAYADAGSRWHQSARQQLRALALECEQTAAAFDVDAVLTAALSRRQASRVNA